MSHVHVYRCKYTRTVLEAPYVVLDVDNQVSRHVCIGTPLEVSTLTDTILYHVNT